MEQQNYSQYEQRETYNRNKYNRADNIFYKGVAYSTLQKIVTSGRIQAKPVKTPTYEGNVVYLSKSENTARSYGDVVLMIDMTGKRVEKSGHSNQFVAIGDIESNRIIQVRR